ncbi:hypothetical protein ESCAB7627_2200 [Escherichia albertii TW07627]|uniref:Uncharacterized protein n=1 Tax=Escherichia albertii (strain TW07627) TaxID=502347 RepID=A0ABC9NKU0_ESCAT|nr:hypothetical protein EAKF1_ch0582 [Escherichia albertii KF1]EDS90737.1 hypothetical protein ESCAB7627_2200 [Escherichia albertii TW07627]OSL32080.1 hypothetical protein EAPG_00726 [Escherichia albertii B156]GAL52333.1 hypothetical protein EA14781_003_00145 [Escherichia albertii NBRC 107761 = DSM 17582]
MHDYAHIRILFFSSSNVFAKRQVIVKAKHRFLVQHASYSLTVTFNHHLISSYTEKIK